MAAGWAALSIGLGMMASVASAAVDVQRPPNSIHVVTDDGGVDLPVDGERNGVRVAVTPATSGLRVQLSAAKLGVKRVELHWAGAIDPATQCLGDAWERAYADLGWRPLDQSGSMPWYFLATAAGRTDGYGVLTGPAAMCHWTADAAGVTLVADVRCGGTGVRLGTRTLDVCTVVGRPGTVGEDPFAAAVAFCHQMCPRPRLPRQPVYGYNDWNSTYGHNTAAGFLRDAAKLAELCPAGDNRPFMVVDDGWQANRQGGHPSGNPWGETNAKFGSTMADLSRDVKRMNARPGLWYRPLEAWASAPKGERLHDGKGPFDPSVPAVRARIVADMQRFRSWGIEFVKHDFSTVEMLGKWGNQLGGNGTADGWAFADRSRTTAEIVLDLYRAIRQGGGDGMTIDGCNTVSHLSAGEFELARIGDDTSGESWDRNPKYGVNALAFRAPQQGAFYAADPDMVALAKRGAIPWAKNRQWLELASHSGTVLFVSWKVSLMDDGVRAALRAAFAAAAEPRAVARPVDWMDTRTPTRWVLDGNREATFEW